MPPWTDDREEEESRCSGRERQSHDRYRARDRRLDRAYHAEQEVETKA